MTDSHKRPHGRKPSRPAASRPKARRKPARDHREWWSQRVTQNSDALDLEQGVFAGKDPKAVALSLKRSAQASRRRKSGPYRSAMSMLTFYINRAGKRLPRRRLKVLEKAKGELRTLFQRPQS
jgi:hypothetical protein